MTGVRADAKL